jgi:GNAT superfamily N-acetyltransferase
MDEEIVLGYRPGAIGRITELHGSYYHEHWGFDLFFESKIAVELSEFLNRYRQDRDGLWLAVTDGTINGSIVVDGIAADQEGAHLRWFIVSTDSQGRGTGKRLMNEALGFCRRAGYRRAYLWTFAGLEAARHLYDKLGFTLTRESEGRRWGRTVTEQRFELTMQP